MHFATSLHRLCHQEKIEVRVDDSLERPGDVSVPAWNTLVDVSIVATDADVEPRINEKRAKFRHIAEQTGLDAPTFLPMVTDAYGSIAGNSSAFIKRLIRGIHRAEFVGDNRTPTRVWQTQDPQPWGAASESALLCKPAGSVERPQRHARPGCCRGDGS